jgi:hypothetical protein
MNRELRRAREPTGFALAPDIANDNADNMPINGKGKK